MAGFFLKVLFFYFREYKLNLSGFHDILTNILFFFISIFIFIFSFGPEKETLSILGIGILWTLLLLSSTLSLENFIRKILITGPILMHLNVCHKPISILKQFPTLFCSNSIFNFNSNSKLLLDITYDKLLCY